MLLNNLHFLIIPDFPNDYSFVHLRDWGRERRKRRKNILRVKSSDAFQESLKNLKQICKLPIEAWDVEGSVSVICYEKKFLL